MRGTAAAPLTQKPRMVPLLEAQTHAFMISQYREPTFHFRWHYHKEIELVWIRNGSGLRYVGRAVEPFKPGDLVLLGSKVPHTWGSAPGQQGEAQWTVIQFEPERWGEGFWQMPELRELRALLGKANLGLQFVGPQVIGIGEMMEQLAKQRPYSFEALAQFLNICQCLLKTSCRSLNSIPVAGIPTQTDPRLQQILALVDSFSNQPLAQADIAARVKMVPSVFCRWFKHHMGRTFQRYVNEVRVARVCARLADGQQSVTAVAFECGFSNLANFNRRFLEITGMTPSAFRTETREISARRARRFIVRHGLHGPLRLAVLNGG